MRRSKLVVALGVAAVTAFTGACQTLDPYTREEQTSRATRNAAIGAGIGAVIGLISGDDAVDRRQKALIGAGIGALAGGAVGYYQDRQQAELRAELEGTGVSVHRVGDNITLNMPGNVTFATDSADLSPQFFAVLNSVSKVLNKYEQTIIEVAGHTDSTGTNQYNQGLSQRRASSVGQYLKSQGIMDQRVMTLGLGEEYPVADNGTASGRQLNRRVELTLVPVTG